MSKSGGKNEAITGKRRPRMAARVNCIDAVLETVRRYTVRENGILKSKVTSLLAGRYAATTRERALRDLVASGAIVSKEIGGKGSGMRGRPGTFYVAAVQKAARAA